MKFTALILILLITTGCQSFGKQAVYKYEECRYLVDGEKVCKKFSAHTRRELDELYFKHKDTEVRTGQITGSDSPLQRALAESLTEAIKKLNIGTLLGDSQ